LRRTPAKLKITAAHLSTIEVELIPFCFGTKITMKGATITIHLLFPLYLENGTSTVEDKYSRTEHNSMKSFWPRNLNWRKRQGDMPIFYKLRKDGKN